ncbi:MAG: glycosyltransferase [Elusimicrobiota bacterium]|nr:glycosyltransferase [Elusimicrobiota bacterium]
MKIAIIHDWLTGMRGGEKCLEVFCELYPSATVFTLVHIKGTVSETIEKMKIKTSFLQHLPGIEKRYRYYLTLMPKAIEQFDLTGYDLILSSSHCVAKGVKVPENSLHICYCYTPMRYIWDMYEQYFGDSKFYIKFAMKMIKPYLRKWDVESSKNVNYFIAISEYIRERIKRHYGCDSDVIFPPVDTDFFTPSTLYPLPSTGYYLIVSAFAPYKKVNLAIETFNKLGLSLKIIGSGQDEKKLKRIAKKNIEFLGWRNNNELRKYYQNCRAIIFPGEEDFGIVPVEAQACGKPVIAYKKGGVLETVIDGITGIFFEEQTMESLSAAVLKFENMKFNSREVRESAERFGRKKFSELIKNYIDEKIKKMYN